MSNRSLMDALESRQTSGTAESTNASVPMRRNSLVALGTDTGFQHRKRNYDLLVDKSEVCFVVIDNSGSMECSDGKIFSREGAEDESSFGQGDDIAPELLLNRKERIAKKGANSRTSVLLKSW